MAAINGTSLLLYSDGRVIALQKGISITVEQDLPDATNKESAGWAQHINGLISAKIDFNALFASSVTGGMDATQLMAYILGRTSLLISILGLTFPMVGQVDLSSLSFDAPGEGTMTLAGSLKVNGPLYPLNGTMVNLITDPDAGGTDYDTLTPSGLAIVSAINAAGTAYVMSNVISVANTGVYKLAVFLTLNSGQAPSVAIYDNTSADISNVVVLVAGLNLITLTSTATDASASLRIRNTGASNFALSPLYLFRTA